MNIFFALLVLFSLNSWSQDPGDYFNKFDQKIYSLKNKGVKDFVVDIESPKLTTQMNDQMTFGKIKELIFRVYWTAVPERYAIEVLGMPDGFKEVKEELKLSISPFLDYIIPPTLPQRFQGYKFSIGSAAKEFKAQDTSGIAMIPSFTIRFDSQDKISEIIGNKFIGSLVITPQYEKESFTDGKWVLKSLSTVNSENGQTISIKKQLSYGFSEGIGVLSKVKIETEQKSEQSKAKSLTQDDEVEFKNYKINTGEGLKYFLGDSNK